MQVVCIPHFIHCNSKPVGKGLKDEKDEILPQRRHIFGHAPGLHPGIRDVHGQLLRDDLLVESEC
jgi:hypothetical protein